MSEERKPLWPKPIEIIGVTGEHESGKTSFCLSICPGQETLVYDFEKSCGTYEADLGFVRVDVPSEMRKIHGSKPYRSLDVFLWWEKHIRSIPPGQYRVIHADPVTDLDSGLTEFVNSNPRLFGATPAQYAKMSGIMWGHMKEYMKAILIDVAARVETFTFASHMSNVWKGDRPSKERKAKGKSTLFELASLYLKMERNKDKNVTPSAVVLKSRLSKMTVLEDDEDGEIINIPLLPPRLPVATPAAIRRYMKNPPDYSNLKPEEKIGEQTLTEDEKLLLRAEIADAERDVTLAQNEREERQGKRLGGVRSSRVVSTSRPVQDDDASADSTQVVTSDEGSEAESEEAASEEEGFRQALTGEVVEKNEAEARPEEESDKAPTPEWTTKPTHGEQLAAAVEDAAKSPRNGNYPAPDEPVGKAMLAALLRNIARYIKAGKPQENILKGIKKRNPRAQSEADLTHGQAEDMDASLSRILDGPHPEPDVTPTTATTQAKSTTSTQPEQPTGQEVPKKSATKKR